VPVALVSGMVSLIEQPPSEEHSTIRTRDHKYLPRGGGQARENALRKC